MASKTFIVDEKIEHITTEIKAIMKKPAPYGEIYRLPSLLEDFVSAYGKILNDMEGPVLAEISEARKRVFDELKDKQCKEQLSGSFIKRFDEIREKAESCNNVAVLQNIKIEADTLKVRCLNEISAAEKKILDDKSAENQAKSSANDSDGGQNADIAATPAKKVKATKTISIRSVNAEHTWQLESEEDVKRYLAELEKRLIAVLEEDTVINIEF